MPAPAPTLGAVPSTLLIPLTARACGDTLFPRVAVGDSHATRLLAAIVTETGADPAPFLADHASLFGVLARTRVLRDRAHDFFEHRPGALGVSLGAGLGHYFQWLDNGANRWIDADLPEVTALRERWLPATGRRLNARVDLTRADWWQHLGLPSGRHEPPLLLLCEGVLMYLTPTQVQAFLATVGQHAPPGSRLLFDLLGWPAIGRAGWHPSVKHTAAQFRWGLRRWSELAAPHPRLRVDAEYRVMEGFGLPFSALGPVFRVVFGVPMYGVVEMGVDA